MSLEGQGQQGERGFAMAALLVSMSVMAVLMSVALPVWRTAAQREKEEELIFRGKQYAHAVTLYQRKFANAYPPSIEALVAGRFLRKKYLDPITGEDFLPLTGSAAAAGQPVAQGQQGAGSGIGAPSPVGGAGGRAPSAPSPGRAGGGQGPTGAASGLIGVVSKSTATSLRIYNGRTHYNEWAFVAQAVTNQPGQGDQPPGPPRGPGRPGAPGRGTAQPGMPGAGSISPGGTPR